MASLRPDRETAVSLISDRPHAPMQSCLVIVSGTEAGQSIEISEDEMAIGRGSECPVCVSDDSVSRKHAVITRVLGHTFVLDLESTNGTFVNDQRIERAELKSNDVLRVGKVALKYVENHLETDYIQHVLGLANTDALTGLFNRSYFDECFGKEVARAQTFGYPCSLVLLDIDHFKQINDEYGHAAGDQVLCHVTSAVQSRLERAGTLFRVGGEEFAILAEKASYASAVVLAETVRTAVATAVCRVAGTAFSVTISLGVAELDPNESAEELYERADTQLYVAKHAGRNRVA